MALHIASDRVDQLARKLARLTGERLTAAIERTLEERLQRMQARPVDPERAERLARMRENVRQCREANLAAGATPPTKAERDALWER